MTQLYLLLIAVSLFASIEALWKNPNPNAAPIFRFFTLLLVNVEWLHSQSKSESIKTRPNRSMSPIPIFIIYIEVLVGVCSAFAGFATLYEATFYYFVGGIFLADFFVEVLSLCMKTHAVKRFNLLLIKAMKSWLILDAFESILFLIAVWVTISAKLSELSRSISTAIIVILFLIMNYCCNREFYANTDVAP